MPEAERKIVFDRFHVMRHVLEAVDKVRKSEHKQLSECGEQVLKGTKYLWLWSEENITEWRREEFDAIRAKDLRICRAWAIKENLRHLWGYRYQAHMRRYFKRWYFRATHSRLGPIKKAAKTLKVHLDNIVTYARHRLRDDASDVLQPVYKFGSAVYAAEGAFLQSMARIRMFVSTQEH